MKVPNMFIFAALITLALIGCKGSEQEMPTVGPKIPSIPTASIPPATTTTPDLSIREGQILAPAEGREAYYDEARLYGDLQARGVSDLPQCLVTFTGAVLREDGDTHVKTRGLAFITASYVVVPASVIPKLPDPNPAPLPFSISIPEGAIVADEPGDLSGWSVIMNLGHDPAFAVGIANPIELPGLRMVAFAIDEQLQAERIRALRPGACRDLVLGDPMQLNPRDMLFGIGFDDEFANFSEEKSSRIVGQVTESSPRDLGFYFFGGIINHRTDMGGLLFALHDDKPELVGIITSSNGSIGLETPHFATSIQEILDALEELESSE